jgi:hypothetical protein
MQSKLQITFLEATQRVPGFKERGRSFPGSFHTGMFTLRGMYECFSGMIEELARHANQSIAKELLISVP